MSNVFFLNRKRDTVTLAEAGAYTPTLIDNSALNVLQHDYQMVLKQTLSKTDYEAVLLAIMDLDYYINLKPELQEIVDNYQMVTGA